MRISGRHERPQQEDQHDEHHEQRERHDHLRRRACWPGARRTPRRSRRPRACPAPPAACAAAADAGAPARRCPCRRGRPRGPRSGARRRAGADATRTSATPFGALEGRGHGGRRAPDPAPRPRSARWRRPGRTASISSWPSTDSTSSRKPLPGGEPVVVGEVAERHDQQDRRGADPYAPRMRAQALGAPPPASVGRVVARRRPRAARAARTRPAARSRAPRAGA